MPAVCPDLAWGERREQDRRRDRTMDLSCIELGTEGLFGREAWGSRDRMGDAGSYGGRKCPLVLTEGSRRKKQRWSFLGLE